MKIQNYNPEMQVMFPIFWITKCHMKHFHLMQSKIEKCFPKTRKWKCHHKYHLDAFKHIISKCTNTKVKCEESCDSSPKLLQQQIDNSINFLYFSSPTFFAKRIDKFILEINYQFLYLKIANRKIFEHWPVICL